MAAVSLEATLRGEALTESRLGRAVGLTSAIKDPFGPNPYINVPVGHPKPLGIDESKFTIVKPGG